MTDDGDRSFKQLFADRAEGIMDYLVMIVAVVIIFLFAVGVVDLGIKIYRNVLSGGIYEPLTVISMIDTIILLFLVVEVFRDIIGYLRELAILPIVIDIAIIAIARKMITFRASEFAEVGTAMQTSITYSIMLLVLLGAFYLVNVHFGAERQRL